MENEKRTIRLIYPQWQGGDIVRWVPEIGNPDEAARGYSLGARLLDFLAPRSGVRTLTVPVVDEIAERRVTDGVLDRDAIVAQTRAAVSMLRASDPDRIVTFGGDCSVSAAPFAFLAGKYGDDAAVIWIDAHPDITLPGDAYSGYHAMALAACMASTRRACCWSVCATGSATKSGRGRGSSASRTSLRRTWPATAARS